MNQFVVDHRLARATRRLPQAALLLIATIVGFFSNFCHSAENNLPVKGEVFTVDGHTAFVILPEKRPTDKPIPWVWYAPTLPNYPAKEEKWMFDKFLNAGMAIAGVDVGESYGSPNGRAAFTKFYDQVTEQHGLSKRPCLLARSRGGLMQYNWAVEHPAAVACIAGIYPVCNLSSYPGLERACGAYGMTQQQLTDQLAEHNPIDRLAPLAKAGVPIFHIHGDNDKVVPLDQNSAVVAQQYEQHGAKITLKIIKGGAHDMWPGWFQDQDLVDFVIKHAE